MSSHLKNKNKNKNFLYTMNRKKSNLKCYLYGKLFILSEKQSSVT